METCAFSGIIAVYFAVSAFAAKPSKSLLNLSDGQKQIYEMVKEERLFIFSVGTLLGAIVSFLVVTWTKLQYPKCAFFSLTYLFSVLFYTVAPKSTYMYDHLQDSQKKDWIQVYNKMKITNAMFSTLAVAALIIRI